MSTTLQERAVLVRLTPPQYVEMVAARHLSRRDRDVLLAIAKRAHFQSWRWGEGSYRCAERIAGDTGYCERSVRYAYKTLVAGGWLDISPRPGRTNVFTVLRPVEPFPLAVDDEADPGDDVGDNRPPDDADTPAPFAGGAATVAPDLDPLPEKPPPVAPDRRSDESVAASRRLNAAPRWRRDTDPPPGTDPPSPTQVRARPHRRDAERDRASGAPPPCPVGGADALLRGVAGLVEGDPMPVSHGEHWTRDAARRLRPCPKCAAPPGEACRRRDGRLRRANHTERRIPRLT